MELIRVENGTACIRNVDASELAYFETKIKELKKKEEELKAALLAEMEAKGIIKIDNEYLTISYIAPTDRETLNSKQLRAELPDIYDTYTEIKPVKASIRLKVK